MTQKKRTCPTCGQTVSRIEYPLFSGQIIGLYKIFKWCERTGTYEFKKKDIKHVLVDNPKADVISSNIHFLKRIGGLVYNPDGKKGSYGLNMGRCREFFRGERKIATLRIYDPVTKESTYENYKYVYEIPKLKEFLDEDDNWIAKYREPEQSTLV